MASVLLKCAILSDMLLHVNPAGAKPRRDLRFLACVSRHEVPKTAGNDDAFKVNDPARVSHLPVRQSVRHPGGVVGSLVMPYPRVFGAAPLDLWLKNGHPSGVRPLTMRRRASVPLKCVILSDMLPHADPAGAKPQRDHRFLARVSRHEVPKTAGDDDAL